MAGNPDYPQLLKHAGPPGPALLEHMMHKYAQGWREINTPKQQDINPLHAIWIAPLLWVLLWVAMALF